jgi:O-succinylbenzoic acid--CoA ligase
VGLALPAGTDLVVLLHACWMAGAVAVPHDLRLTEAERPAADHVVDAVAPRPVDGTSLHREHDLAATAVLLQTSGTSGAPKPVALTFGNLLWSALGSAVALGTDPDERWLCALPLSHVGGLGIVVRAAIAGSTALVHPGGTPSGCCTPSSTRRHARLRRPHDARAASGRGPAPPAPPAVRADRRRARAARARAPRGARGRPGGPDLRAHGGLLAGDDRRARGPRARRRPAALLHRVRIAPDGEILVSGPTVAGPPGRELATGDLGALDGSGRLTVTGRKADTIVSGGENVAPTEVEAALAEHPAVAEAAVFGRPDPAWGEAVVARVVLRPGAHATEAELRRHAAARLAGFKVPKEIAFAPALPRTASGKVLRRALRS